MTSRERSTYSAAAYAGARTELQRATVEALVQTQSANEAAQILGKNPVDLQKLYRRCIAKAEAEAEEAGEDIHTEEPSTPCEARALLDYHRARDVSRYVVVSAQNATPVHRGFMASIMRYCEDRGARLIVIPYRYKNPTSMFSKGDQENDWWAPELVPYMLSSDVDITDTLMIAGSIKIRPTAQVPLSGMQAYSKAKSMIIGHPKVQLRSIPTIQGTLPKILTTTGSVTVENYTDSKAGRLGEFGHVIGGTILETRGSAFQLRQINADGRGGFTDLDRHYSPGGVTIAEPAEILTCGDVHHAQMDPEAERATFCEGGLVDKVRPRRLAIHDLLDFRARNHHDAGDIFLEAEKARHGTDDVEAEVRAALEWLAWAAEGFEETLVVESNHNEALTRWLKEGRGATDPRNAWFYHRTMAALLADPSGGREASHPLEYWYGVNHRQGPRGVRFLRRNESALVNGVEHSMHGDVGPNGSRGSTKAFDQLGVKSTSGHCHGPEIFGGVYRVGIMGDHQMGYNERGPGNWLTTHAIQYATGARTLVTMVDGAFWID